VDDLLPLLHGRELISVRAHADSAEELLGSLAERLRAGGYVRASYREALLAREREHPTGLPVPGVGVAIPHADAEHVQQAAMAVATLQRPVTFGVMGDVEATVDVSVVFLLALDDAAGHLRALRQIVGFVQDAPRLRRLSDADSVEQALAALSAAAPRSATASASTSTGEAMSNLEAAPASHAEGTRP
jgi:galactitol PTS system EIIA component